MNLADLGINTTKSGTINCEEFIKYREEIENNTINKSKTQFLEYELLQQKIKLLPNSLILWENLKNLIEDLIYEKESNAETQKDIEINREQNGNINNYGNNLNNNLKNRLYQGKKEKDSSNIQ